MMELHEQASEIRTRAELVAFIEALRKDLQAKPEGWENVTLESFLGGLSRWVEDMDGYYRKNGLDIPQAPTWKTVGEMLAAARIYE